MWVDYRRSVKKEYLALKRSSEVFVRWQFPSDSTLLSAQIIGWKDARILILGTQRGTKGRKDHLKQPHDNFARAEASVEIGALCRCQYLGFNTLSCGEGRCHFSPALISIWLPVWSAAHAGESLSEGEQENKKLMDWSDTKGTQLVFLFQSEQTLSNSSGCVINTVVRNIVHTRYWPDAVRKPFCGSYNLDVERFVSCPVIETQLQRLSFMLGLSPCVKSARWVWVVKDILTLLTAHINLKVPEDGSVLFNADVWKVKQNN